MSIIFKCYAMAKIQAEYIWLDGYSPTANLRSKTKILDAPPTSLQNLPEWGFDGSSTRQAEGKSSDCLLKPVAFFNDPIRGGENILVLCEVFNPDGTAHTSNTRARLRRVAETYASHDAWFGIEQEYVLMQDGRPLGWPSFGYPSPQGDYYTGVGAANVAGRELIEAHTDACLRARLAICGTNAEVMLGQWEFQIGPVGPLAVGDELWVARWLLQRLGEDYDISVNLDAKPIKGDWNGSGAHTNISTTATRAEGGIKVIEAMCEQLGKFHEQHMKVYGANNHERLTGHHETCSIHEFRYGVSHRGASIRIPMGTANSGRGYFEDRRPAANMDPYQVVTAVLETICGDGFRP